MRERARVVEQRRRGCGGRMMTWRGRAGVWRVCVERRDGGGGSEYDEPRT